MATAQPSPIRARAVALPIPRDPPLTTATPHGGEVASLFTEPSFDRFSVSSQRACVVAITAIALLLALNSSASLVGILLFAYTGISQFAPGIVATLVSKRATARGVLAGLVCGLTTCGWLFFTGRDPFHLVSVGLVGLVANVGVLVFVSALSGAGKAQRAAPGAQSA